MKLDKRKVEIILANKNWDQTDLAKAYGCSSSQISLFLSTDKAYNNPKIVYRIKELLGVKKIEDIITDKD